MKESVQRNNTVVFILGRSGSGLSVAIKSLEDLNFFCIDNLPINLIPSAVEWFSKARDKKSVGIGLAVRLVESDHALAFNSLVDEVKKSFKVKVICLTASDQVLGNRYSALKRLHPLAKSNLNIADCIELEKKIFEKVEETADLVIETSTLSPYQLAKILEFTLKNRLDFRVLHVQIFSFGFKYGAPQQFDSVVDVRCLPNPYFCDSLRKKTGLEKPVKDYILRYSIAQEMLDRLVKWNTWALPKYHAEGKHYFRIGIGCTGGQHRSVFIADALAGELRKNKTDLDHMVFSVQHRELGLLDVE